MQSKKELVELLNSSQCSCVVANEHTTLTFHERGVKDLQRLLGDESQPLNGAFIADKVVGKAAAFLYALMKVRSVYAYTVSEPALEVLAGAGIEVCAEKVVPAIRNRTDTGQCPMETLVWDTSDAYQAYEKLKKATESGGLR